MNDGETAYDRVQYPSAVFTQTYPERLALLARLAGLDPVLPNEARILEVGGGDCLNAIAFAVPHPGAQVHGFDIAETAIAKGEAIVRGAEVANVTLAVEDIMRAHERYAPRSFDYVIVHGVYAWVPPGVREATMALIGHVLSDRGVAFVSYNLAAGGHFRQFMRDMMFEVLRGIEDPDAKLARAREYIQDYMRPRDDDAQLNRVLRAYAAKMLEKPGSVLFHDELGDCYYPQYLREVCEAGERYGLRHLTDAGRNRYLDGFLGEDEELVGNGDEQVLRAAQMDDFDIPRFFRQTLLVRQEQPIDRRIDLARIDGLLVSTRLRRDEETGDLVLGEDRLSLQDADFAERIDALGRAFPERLPIGKIAINEEQRKALLQMFAEWYVALHFDPPPYPLVVGDNPKTSPLVRYLLESGEALVATLDHGMLRIDQPEMRALLLAANGDRNVEEIATMEHGIPGTEVKAALDAAARRGLMVA